MARTAGLLVLLYLGGGQAAGGMHLAQAPQAAASVDSADARATAQLILGAARELQAPQLLGAWKAQHRGAKIVAASGNAMVADGQKEWCARADMPLTLPSGQPITRSVYFYPPAPDPVAPLPVHQPPDQILDQQCQPGVVRFWPLPTVEEIKASLMEQAGSDLSDWKQVSWMSDRESASWRDGAARIGYGSIVYAVSGTGVGRAPGGFEFAVIGASYYTAPTPSDASYIPPGRIDPDAMLREGLRLGNATAAESATALGLEQRPDAEPHPQWTPLLQFLSGWMGNAGPPISVQRSARIYATWLLLPFVPDQDAGGAGFRSAIHEAIGVEYEPAELDGGWGKPPTLLLQASAADAAGPAGELVALQRIDGACSSHEVLELAEPWLQKGFDRWRAQFELDEGEAWKAALLDMQNPSNDEPPPDPADLKLAATMAEANAKAVVHLQAALAGFNPDSATARYLWSESWLLLAGLPPHMARFRCYDD